MDSAQIPGVGRPGDQLKLARLDFQGIGLSPNELTIATRLREGPLTAEELLLKSGLPREEAISHLSRLVSAGVLQKVVVENAPQAPQPPAVAAAASTGFTTDA